MNHAEDVTGEPIVIVTCDDDDGKPPYLMFDNRPLNGPDIPASALLRVDFLNAQRLVASLNRILKKEAEKK